MPLKLAVCGRHYDIVEMLGNAGASMREVEDVNFSALGFADDLNIPNVEPRLRDLIHKLDDAQMTKIAQSATKLENKTAAMKPLRLKPKI